MLKWPDAEAVDEAVRAWARDEGEHRPDLLRLGYFGSYARGDWGVGSDVDLVAIVTDSDRPWAERALDWDLAGMPVPAQLLVYTAAEWERMRSEGRRFARTVEREAVWVFARA